MNERKTTHKQYIGDGVYAAYDGYHIVLTTENGIETTNTICLERSVYESLVHYATALNRAREGDFKQRNISFPSEDQLSVMEQSYDQFQIDGGES